MQKKFSSLIALAVIAVIVLAVNLLGSILFPRAKIDMTEEKLFTLSEGSRNIASSVENDVSFKFFYSKTAVANIPFLKNYANRIMDLLKEYQIASDGKISLEVIDPRPDTEEEEAAELAGLQGAPGDRGRIFLGLLMRDRDSGQEAKIPFLNPSQESTLEYDISKALYSIAYPDKKRVGIISSLPVMGGAPPQSMMMNPMMRQPPSQAWAVVRQLKENFRVEEIKTDAQELPKNLDLLLIIHPKKLDPVLEYRIDQFMMAGGKALLFVDPFCETDMTALRQMAGNNMQLMMQSSFHSTVPMPFSKWGVGLRSGADKSGGFSAMGADGPAPLIAADQNLGWEARMNDGSIQKIFAFLQLGDENLDRGAIITSQLHDLLLPTPGALKEFTGPDNLEVDILMETTDEASAVDGMMMKFTGNPIGLNDSYKPGSSKLPLAYKIMGKFKTAFPEGKPNPDDPAGKAIKDDTHRAEAEEEGVLVVVADVDMISDRYSVRTMNFLGRQIISPINDNFAFLANTVENLVGSRDLIGLRSRGTSSRPFTRVKEIEREAQKEFLKERQALEQELEEANRRWDELKKQTSETAVLTRGLAEERRKVKVKQVETRRKLREVKRNLREKVERLGFALKFVNIALIPLVVILLSLVISVLRATSRKRAA